jgi:hypothetical protein
MVAILSHKNSVHNVTTRCYVTHHRHKHLDPNKRDVRVELRTQTTVQFARSTRRHILKNGILHSHCRENLKSYNSSVVRFQ